MTHTIAPFGKFYKVIALTLVVAFMPGCTAVTKKFENNQKQIVAEPDKVSAMLAHAADRASDALETLAAVEQAKTPDISVEPVSNVPGNLRRAISVNWIGPVDTITQSLANRAGYRYSVTGLEPPVPIVVSIDVENTPLIDVLRDIGLQLGFRADVKVDGNRKTVEIHYAPAGGAKPPKT